MSIYLSDSRDGCIRMDDPRPAIAGIRFGRPLNEAVFLVEQEEDALYLSGTRKLQSCWPTHGPSSIQVLNDYEMELDNRHVIVLYRNDFVGHKFAQIAARILLRFAKPRLLKVNLPVREWIRQHSRDEIHKAIPRPLREGELHIITR